MKPLASRSLFLTALLICASHLHAAQITDEYLISLKNFTAPEVNYKDQVVTVRTAEIIKVLDHKGNFLLVQTWNGARSTWVPKSNATSSRSFAPMNSWVGHPLLHIASDSGDAIMTYTINRDGSFRAVIENSSSKPLESSGRLHRYSNVVLAKHTGQSSPYVQWNTFRLTSDNRLCFLFVVSEGCQCNARERKERQSDPMPIC